VSSFLNNAITAASINTGAITNAKFAAGAIDAAAIADNAIDNATFAADTTLKNLHAGTAQSGTLGTIVLAAGASSTNNIYDGHRVQIISGTGANQSRVCNTYNGTSKTVTLTENWATAPDNTSVYVVAPLGDVEVGVCNDKTGYSLATGAIASTTFATGAITADAIAADAIGSSELAASAVTEIAGGITIPTAASIADAVWDETAGDHAGAGSTGAALSAATAPSASTVASAVRTELATELGRIDVAISTISGTAGPGGDAVTLVIKDGGGNAIPDVGVWISQDEAGTNVIAGTLYTNASGEATFMLSADTYYRWCKKAGYNFSNPTAFTVT
jgi:hypothetical protein